MGFAFPGEVRFTIFWTLLDMVLCEASGISNLKFKNQNASGFSFNFKKPNLKRRKNDAVGGDDGP
jgi:hypothetical protein